MEVPHRDLGDGDIGEAGANRPSLVFALVLSHVLVSAAQARGTLAGPTPDTAAQPQPWA
jgi:hypothetical protein